MGIWIALDKQNRIIGGRVDNSLTARGMAAELGEWVLKGYQVRHTEDYPIIVGDIYKESGKEVKVAHIAWSDKSPNSCWQSYEFEKTNPYWALDGFRELDHFWTQIGEVYTLHVIYQTRESIREQQG